MSDCNCLFLFYNYFLFIPFSVTIKPGTSPLELQNLMSLVKSVNLPGGAQAQTFVVMNHQKTNVPTVVSSAVSPTPPTVVQSKLFVKIYI